MTWTDLIVAGGITGLLFVAFTLFGPKRECASGTECSSCGATCALRGDHDDA